MRSALILVLLLCSTAGAGPLQDLERAQRNFKSKDCQSAIPILKDLLYPKPQLSRTSDLCEAHVLLGSATTRAGGATTRRASSKRASASIPPRRSSR